MIQSVRIEWTDQWGKYRFASLGDEDECNIDEAIDSVREHGGHDINVIFG